MLRAALQRLNSIDNFIDQNVETWAIIGDVATASFLRALESAVGETIGLGRGQMSPDQLASLPDRYFETTLHYWGADLAQVAFDASSFQEAMGPPPRVRTLFTGPLDRRQPIGARWFQPVELLPALTAVKGALIFADEVLIPDLAAAFVPFTPVVDSDGKAEIIQGVVTPHGVELVGWDDYFRDCIRQLAWVWIDLRPLVEDGYIKFLPGGESVLLGHAEHELAELLLGEKPAEDHGDPYMGRSFRELVALAAMVDGYLLDGSTKSERQLKEQPLVRLQRADEMARIQFPNLGRLKGIKLHELLRNSEALSDVRTEIANLLQRVPDTGDSERAVRRLEAEASDSMPAVLNRLRHDGAFSLSHLAGTGVAIGVAAVELAITGTLGIGTAAAAAGSPVPAIASWFQSRSDRQRAMAIRHR